MRSSTRFVHHALLFGAMALAVFGLLANVADARDISARIIEPSATNIQSWTYEPNVINAAVGDRITWINEGKVQHTVTASGSARGAFDSSLINAGATFSWMPTAPGTYPYLCILHPWMTGSVEVVAAAAAAPPAAPATGPGPAAPPAQVAPATPPGQAAPPAQVPGAAAQPAQLPRTGDSVVAPAIRLAAVGLPLLAAGVWLRRRVSGRRS